MLVRKSKKKKGWYRRKAFAHFDVPHDIATIESYVTSPPKVTKHSFYPFITFEKTERRFRGESGKRIKKIKIRPLAYCAHIDGYIFSYYAKLLSRQYEQFLTRSNISGCVIGYRAKIGTNLDFAAEAFDRVERKPRSVALAIDITGFFDSIPHDTLKINLCRLMGVEKLPDDVWTVYRRMTRYASVNFEDICVALGKPKQTVLDADRVCDPDEFRKKIRGAGLVKTNEKKFGIPQGSPISALFSNIVMMEFDLAMAKACSGRGAFYRRYSDDICIICHPRCHAGLWNVVQREIKKVGSSLNIEEGKTEISVFEKTASGYTCDYPFTYLGCTFDGQRRLIKNGSVSRFYSKLVRGANAARSLAKSRHGKKPFRRDLYDRYTHLGDKNFVSYAYRASKTLNHPAPRRQLKKHFKILKSILDKP